jgi:hypothetical protein
MSLRTAAIEVSLQRLNILRIEHPQANPLRLACILRAGETLPSGLTLTAEIHTSRNVAAETAPLASTTVSVGAGALTFDVDFTSAQLNQTVTPDSTRALWLVLYGVGDADQLYTLATADLLLGWHAISRLTASPPATAILIEKGGVAWVTSRTYASGTVVTVGTTAYVATSAHTSGSTTQPGTGASWATVWAVLSGGGGGGATNLTSTLAPTTVTINSDTGTDAVIPSADGTNAGVLTSAFWSKLNDLPTADTLGALATRDTVGSAQIDSDAVGTLQIANGAVTVAKTSGFGNVATRNVGTTTGTAAAGDDSRFHAAVTLASSVADIFTLSGQELRTGSFDQDTIIFYDFSASKLTQLTLGAGLTISGTVISAPAGGGGSELQIRDSATGALAAVAGTSVSGTTVIMGAGDNLGTGTAERLRLRNTTPSVSGTNQNSPAVAFEGSAWQTSASASQACEIRAYVIPQTGASIAAGRLTFEARLNGGAWSEIAAFRAGFGTSGLFLGSGSFANIITSNNSVGVYASSNQLVLSVSTTGGHFVGPFSVRSGANDATLNADAAHQLAQRSGTNAQVFRVYDTFASATDYQRVSIATARAVLSGLSGASVTATSLIPAGAVVVGVTAKVLTAVTGATSWQLGTAADPDRFAAAGGIALGSTTQNSDWTAGGIECFPAATNLILTANGSNFTAGSIQISVQYLRGEAD